MPNVKNLHDNHRSRMRERYKREGFSNFHEHEILELVLYYSIPRRDVNPIAHKLLNHFGSLHGILDATVPELMSVDGIGEASATLLHMIPDLFRAYELCKYDDKPYLKDVASICEYCRKLLMSQTNEVFYLICLDSSKRILSAVKMQEGVVDEVQIYTRSVVEKALHNKAHSVVLAHNHPNGVLMPSRNDIYATKRVIEALAGISIQLLDHIIVANNSHISMKENGFI